MIALLFFIGLPVGIFLAGYLTGRRDGRELCSEHADAIYNAGVQEGTRTERQQRRIEGESDINAAEWWKGDQH